jgi:hypothetical protein
MPQDPQGKRESQRSRPWIRLPALGVGVGGLGGADLPQKLVGAVLVQQGLQLLRGGQLEQVFEPAGAPSLSSMIAGNRACSIFSPSIHPTITNQISQYDAETVRGA